MNVVPTISNTIATMSTNQPCICTPYEVPGSSGTPIGQARRLVDAASPEGAAP